MISRRSLSGWSPLSGLMPLRKERARTALCHWVVPETPVPALMPERLGWLMSWTAPSAAMARPASCCCETNSGKHGVPAGPGWIYEIKHDGFRILARRDRERVRLFTRHGTDFTARYPKIAAAVESLPVRSCALDGVCSALTESNSAGANQCQARARDSVPNAGSSGGS